MFYEFSGLCFVDTTEPAPAPAPAPTPAPALAPAPASVDLSPRLEHPWSWGDPQFVFVLLVSFSAQLFLLATWVFLLLCVRVQHDLVSSVALLFRGSLWEGTIKGQHVRMCIVVASVKSKKAKTGNAQMLTCSNAQNTKECPNENTATCQDSLPTENNSDFHEPRLQVTSTP